MITQSGVGFASPVKDGMEERWRRFLQELASTRRAAYDDLRRRHGITRHLVWLLRVRGADVAIAYAECAEPETLVARLAASTEPFDVWFMARWSEFHGCDLARPELRWSPEQVFDSTRLESDGADQT